MARITFTANLERHVACPPADVPGPTVREVLERYFEEWFGGGDAKHS